MLVLSTEYFQLHPVRIALDVVKVNVLNLRPILRSPGGGCLLDRWTYKPIVSHWHFGKRLCNSRSSQPCDRKIYFSLVTAKSHAFFYLASICMTCLVCHESYQLRTLYVISILKYFIFGTRIRISITKNFQRILVIVIQVREMKAGPPLLYAWHRYRIKHRNGTIECSGDIRTARLLHSHGLHGVLLKVSQWQD